MSKKNKSERVKLIANPHAGKAAGAAKDVMLAAGLLEKRGLKVDVALAHPKEAATQIARKAVKDGYRRVVVMGGDGTIEAVIRGVVGSKARLGIIPRGTANNVARSLCIPIDLEQACDLIASDHVLDLDTGRIKTSNGKKFVFFEIATVGVSAAVYPAANKISNGKLGEIINAISTFAKQETRPKVFLTLNDESKVEVDTMLVTISNTPLFGKNFWVAPKASVQDGLLDVTVYPDFSKAELLRFFAALMDGGSSSDHKVQQYQVRRLKIKTQPKMPLMADGVELGTGKVKIKVRTGFLHVITTGQISGPEDLKQQTTEQKTATASETDPNNPKNERPAEEAIVVGNA